MDFFFVGVVSGRVKFLHAGMQPRFKTKNTEGNFENLPIRQMLRARWTEPFPAGEFMQGRLQTLHVECRGAPMAQYHITPVSAPSTCIIVVDTAMKESPEELKDLIVTSRSHEDHMKITRVTREKEKGSSTNLPQRIY